MDTSPRVGFPMSVYHHALCWCPLDHYLVCDNILVSIKSQIIPLWKHWLIAGQTTQLWKYKSCLTIDLNIKIQFENKFSFFPGVSSENHKLTKFPTIGFPPAPNMIARPTVWAQSAKLAKVEDGKRWSKYMERWKDGQSGASASKCPNVGRSFELKSPIWVNYLPILNTWLFPFSCFFCWMYFKSLVKFLVQDIIVLGFIYFAPWILQQIPTDFLI